MIIYIGGIEPYYFLKYPYQWIRLSRTSERKLKVLYKNCKELIIEIDTPITFELPPTIYYNPKGQKNFRQKKFSNQYEEREVSIDAPYPNTIKKSPIKNLNHILPKRKYKIHGVKYNNLYDYTDKQIKFNGYRIEERHNPYHQNFGVEIKLHLKEIWKLQQYILQE